MHKLFIFQFFIVLLINSNVFGDGSSKNDEPRFSIGLGVLAPSYSQKLPGNGRLDVNQESNGAFSFNLNNVHAAPTGQAYSPPASSAPAKETYVRIRLINELVN